MIIDTKLPKRLLCLQRLNFTVGLHRKHKIERRLICMINWFYLAINELVSSYLTSWNTI